MFLLIYSESQPPLRVILGLDEIRVKLECCCLLVNMYCIYIVSASIFITRISRSRFHQSRYFSATRSARKGLCLLKTVRVVSFVTFLLRIVSMLLGTLRGCLSFWNFRHPIGRRLPVIFFYLFFVCDFYTASVLLSQLGGHGQIPFLNCSVVWTRRK